MEISEGVIRRGRNTLLDLHNSSKDTQPHSFIVNSVLYFVKSHRLFPNVICLLKLIWESLYPI